MTEDKLKEVLNLCYEKGIDAQIQLHTDLVRENYNVFTSAFPNINFADYPALKGFFIVDEPQWRQIDYIRDNYVAWFNQNYADSGLEFYVNLLGGYSSWIGPMDADGNINYDGHSDKLFGSDCSAVQKATFYTNYVNHWLEVFKLINGKNKFFTIDEYPFADNQSGMVIIDSEELRSKYVEQYGIPSENILIAGNMPDGYEYYIEEDWLERTFKAAVTAKENGYQFGAFIQAMDEGGTEVFRLPTTLAEIKWQAYMNIAFGAKKLIYYAYDHHPGGSYMTQNGNPLNLYNYVQETNAEILSIGNVLMAFDTWVGAKSYPADGAIKSLALQYVVDMELEELTGVTSVVSDKELIVGEMVDADGNHGYMLVGYDDPLNGNSTKVEMTFDGADGFIIYRNCQRTLSEDFTGGILSVTLAAGEGLFVIPVYAN